MFLFFILLGCSKYPKLSYIGIGDDMEYNSNKPYPEIRVERPNLEYAKILLSDYAGEVSEDTAIHLYLYQHLVSDDIWNYYSDIIEHISIVEMRHLEILGKLIKLLGLDPDFVSLKDNKLVSWNAKFVNYETDLNKMLDIDISSETKAIENYRCHYELIGDRYIRENLLRIIEDEEVHLKIFKDLKGLIKNI